MRRIYLFVITVLMSLSLNINAQGFFNLTSDEVRIDSLLPYFTYSHDLGYEYADSVYEVAIEYPEFIPMTKTDIMRYQAIISDTLPMMPDVESHVAVDRKRGVLEVMFVPLAKRNGVMCKLVSFKLTVTAKAKRGGKKLSPSASGTRATNASASGRYAASSVLASGRWAKIRIPSTGIYQLTDALLSEAGFSNPSKVKIYGYGGALQQEKLTDEYLRETDDLKELPTCVVGGKRLFFGRGPVSWDASGQRIRNPYSQYGYYFLTENDATPLMLSESDFENSCKNDASYSNTLYEVDNFAWYSGGRNLYDERLLPTGTPVDYTLSSTPNASTGRLTVSITADNASRIDVLLNDKHVAYISISAPKNSYEYAAGTTTGYNVSNVQASNKITLKKLSGGNVRLDYISLRNNTSASMPDLHSASFPVPEFVHAVANQNRHADESVDMIILLPSGRKLQAEAERLKTLHEKHDGMTVRIVSADELYNEFSSGTPDASAYRRYMKMLYDRAADASQIPSALLLFGDCAWDNRMLLSDWKEYSPDDFLLCFESENSFSATNSYISDDFFCMLDDEEVIQTGTGSSITYRGKPDVAVGRFPVRTVEQAKVMVDKVEAYMKNANAGAWQNTVVFMGDDGNNNIHMKDADEIAKAVETVCSSYDIKRIMWDSYNRVSSSTGFTYPDVTNLIKKYMNSGALMMNYSGHGSPHTVSHELVLGIDDFRKATSKGLPLWVTASCDIMPYDSQKPSIGEEAVFNSKGGALAFYGTTRTVYSHENRLMNLAFSRAVLDPAQHLTIGEAARVAKNSLVSTGSDISVNKMQYALLGDPALRLALPRLKAVIDEVNGQSLAESGQLTLKAGELVKISGHIEDNGMLATDFAGTMTALVNDAKQEIICRLNDTGTDGAEEPFHYYDYSGTVFNGNDAVRDGRFAFSFVVPKDISYSDKAAALRIHAVNDAKDKLAAGNTDKIAFNGSVDFKEESVGPAIYCYLNSSSFVNGAVVNATPYFMAELNDEDGINAAGNGIGHDLQLIIDGEASQTYSLNDYFSYDFGTYKSGYIGFSIPRLTEGKHKLLFRAWDVLNNSSTSELTFVVSNSAAPTLFDIECTKNPARTSTSFRLIHDRIASQMDVKIEIFDMSGRHIWTYTANGVPTDDTFTVDWDLTVNGGRRIGTGVYLYRAGVSCDGSDYSSKTKKLIVLSNN